MAGSLVDSSVWLAAVFPQHPHHVRAQEELSIATPLAPAAFCRATLQRFLRLITTPQILRAYAVEAMTNRSAWKTFELLRAHSSIVVHDEPPGTVALWHRLAAGDTASPKVWTTTTPAVAKPTACGSVSARNGSASTVRCRRTTFERCSLASRRERVA